jgi:hypothetical protein
MWSVPPVVGRPGMAPVRRGGRRFEAPRGGRAGAGARWGRSRRERRGKGHCRIDRGRPDGEAGACQSPITRPATASSPPAKPPPPPRSPYPRNHPPRHRERARRGPPADGGRPSRTPSPSSLGPQPCDLTPESTYAAVGPARDVHRRSRSHATRVVAWGRRFAASSPRCRGKGAERRNAVSIHSRCRGKGADRSPALPRERRSRVPTPALVLEAPWNGSRPRSESPALLLIIPHNWRQT